MTASRSKSCSNAAYKAVIIAAAAVFAVCARAFAGNLPDVAAQSSSVYIPTLVKAGKTSVNYALNIGPLSPVTSIAISADGSRLAVGGYRQVTLLDLKAGVPSAPIFELAGQVQSLAFHPGGGYLAIAGGEPGRWSQAIVVDLADLSRKTFLLGHEDVVNSISWSADGKWICTAGQDKTARVWSWPGGLISAVLKGQSDSVTRARFSPDGRHVYTASLDRYVRKFDSANGRMVKSFNVSGDSVHALAVHPTSGHVVSSGPEARIRWWNPDSGETYRYSDGSGAEVNDIVFSPDGKMMASAGADRAVRLWNADNGAQKHGLAASGDWMYAAALSPDGKMAVGGGADGLVRIWETGSGRLRATIVVNCCRRIEDLNWIAITPEGYYAGSPRWSADVRPRAEGTRIEASVVQFVRTLMRPDIVQVSLAAGEVKVAEIPASAKPPATDQKAGGK